MASNGDYQDLGSQQHSDPRNGQVLRQAFGFKRMRGSPESGPMQHSQ